MTALLEYSSKRKNQEIKFLALLHGADPKDLDLEDSSISNENLIFRDPADYEKMTEEERTELSNRMMAKFSGWAKGAL